MTRDDLRYIPHNFAEFMNSDIIDQHKALLSSSDYSEAVNLLNQNLQVEGMCADLFNTIEQKILFVANQLEGKTKPEYIFRRGAAFGASAGAGTASFAGTPIFPP